jgi:hypothetical protein
MHSHFRLLKTHWLEDFPSGSALAFRNGRLYVVGDDATCILIVDTDFQKVDTIPLFDFPDKRIPKAGKTDFEACTLLTLDGTEQLLLVGSAATEIRQKVCLMPFQDGMPEIAVRTDSFHDNKAFIQRLPGREIPEVNIEGVCTIGERLLLGNRGNLTHPTNHLIVTDLDFWQHPEDAHLHVLSLILPVQDLEAPLGLSELCYIAETDVLLLTLTSESTANAYDDGAIGDSYLGWVSHASQQLDRTTLIVDQMVNLSEVDVAFQGNKIEGICVASVSSSQALLHLVADNDAGDSRLFTLEWMW